MRGLAGSHRSFFDLIELRHLRHFVAVAELGNISAAAKTACISQSALTRSIQSLETELGARLVDRSVKGSVPTIAGLEFLNYARLILADCERSTLAIRARLAGAQNAVNLGIAALFSGCLGSDVVTRVAQDLKTVQLAISEGYFEDLVARLRTGSIDLALTNLPPSILGDDLIVEPLLELAL